MSTKYWLAVANIDYRSKHKYYISRKYIKLKCLQKVGHFIQGQADLNWDHADNDMEHNDVTDTTFF